MTEQRTDPTAVLRQFVEDVQAAYGRGEDRELDRETLHADWPDLLVTFDDAVQALADAADPGLVVVCVEGGMVSGVSAPDGVAVEVRDYDIDHVEDARIHRDNDGRPHTRSRWGPRQCPIERGSRMMKWRQLADRIAAMTPQERAQAVRFVEPYDKDRVGYAVQLVRATEDIHVGDRDAQGSRGDHLRRPRRLVASFRALGGNRRTPLG